MVVQVLSLLCTGTSADNNFEERLRFQAVTGGNYVDSLESKDIIFRVGSSGVSEALRIDASDISVLAKYDLYAINGDIQMVSLGTGNNERAVLKIESDSTVTATSNVFLLAKVETTMLPSLLVEMHISTVKLLHLMLVLQMETLNKTSHLQTHSLQML